MKQQVTESLAKLEKSLAKHRSMDDQENPVLSRLRGRWMDKCEVKGVLGQYSLLPAHIVDFLAAGADRLAGWPAVAKELARNIGEEQGSRTEGWSHYQILRAAVLRELSIDLIDVVPEEVTDNFLSSIKIRLADESEPFVAGMLYGLEDSAIPELVIIAKIINAYAKLIGLNNEPIDLSGIRSRQRVCKSQADGIDKYSLDHFFAAHMLDFEVGHRNGLATAVEGYLSSPRDLEQFEKGFEYVLNLMDDWWSALAFGNNGKIEKASRPSKSEVLTVA